MLMSVLEHEHKIGKLPRSYRTFENHKWDMALGAKNEWNLHRCVHPNPTLSYYRPGHSRGAATTASQQDRQISLSLRSWCVARENRQWLINE